MLMVLGKTVGMVAVNVIWQITNLRNSGAVEYICGNKNEDVWKCGVVNDMGPGDLEVTRPGQLRVG
jgi:hypothetical protein